MSYLVFCTFDLKGASHQDYQNAYAELAKLGLRKVVRADNGNDVVVPTTAAMGELTDASAGDVRTNVANSVQSAFRARHLTAEIFIVVGGDWSWGARKT